MLKSTPFVTLSDPVEHGCRADPHAPVLMSPGRQTLTYGDLDRQLRRVSADLTRAGVTRQQRIAIVLPNGPELAVAVLAVGARAICAPLNPGYRADELRFYFEDLRPTLLLVAASDSGPARDVAKALGIRCLEVHWSDANAAGEFEIRGPGDGMATDASDPDAGRDPVPDDIALLLHTSGTTSRPKVVPLTHRNLVRSAANVASWLQLQPADRCLNLMPLFHIHGIVAALLGSLAAGASVACVDRFRHGGFATLVSDVQPTWYTAVPTMHQAILEELESQGTAPVGHLLRFARSSSAPLPARVAHALEAALGVPVIEAYGMTEAAHQIASNPPPPRARKPGTVGLPAGPEIAILDADGHVLGPDEAGEVAIRGENVMREYEGNPDANRAAFQAGWFRTGDQGSIDADGYLTLTGRLKEFINRGGEKISPQEVDEVLLGHPSVQQAVTFAVEHPTLGEDVAAAVVLRAGAAATDEELRHFANDHLASFKVPSRILITDRIPTGATGKIQRIGLARQFAREWTAATVAPANPTEAMVAAIFAEVLASGPVGVTDNFFALGGDSLRGGQVLSRVQARFDVELPPLTLFRSPTVAGFAQEIERALNEQRSRDDANAGHVLLARALVAEGVTHVYTVPALPIYEAVGACAAAGLRVIGTRNQQAAALMATAQNYAAGRPVAAVFVTTGTPATNALTGALVARDNCWPLLVLVGTVAHRERYSGQFMGLDTLAVYQTVTKSATTIRSAADISASIARALHLATEGRPGPVLLELPADVLSEKARFLMPPATSAAEAAPITADALDKVVEWLAASKRPLLILGKGVRWADPFAQLVALVDRASLPFVTSPIARGYVSDGHPLCCNDIAWAAQREADFVLVLGARLDWTFRYGSEIHPDAQVVQVDIQANEIGRNRPAQLGIHGDAGVFLRGLLARFPEQTTLADRSKPRRAWIDDLARRREQVVRARADAAGSARIPISPQAFAAAVAAALPKDAVTILDANVTMAACQQAIPVHHPLGRLTSGSNGCMGTGIPFAIGTKMQRPEQPVIAICGDFAFGLSAFEMETAIRHNVPIVVIVANNDGNSGSLRQRTMFPNGHSERVAMFQPGIRYEKIVEAFGGHAEYVDHIEQLGPAISRALACGKPACINVAIDPDAPYPRS